MAKTEIPAWKAGRKSALTAWRDTLPPEDRAAMNLAWRAAKEGSLARREKREDETRAMVVAALEGATTEEIAKRLTVSRAKVRDRLARLGVEGTPAGLRRAPAAFIPAAVRGAIEALAAERGASVGELLADVLTLAFEEGAFHARRLLGRSVKA